MSVSISGDLYIIYNPNNTVFGDDFKLNSCLLKFVGITFNKEMEQNIIGTEVKMQQLHFAGTTFNQPQQVALDILGTVAKTFPSHHVCVVENKHGYLTAVHFSPTTTKFAAQSLWKYIAESSMAKLQASLVNASRGVASQIMNLPD